MRTSPYVSRRPAIDLALDAAAKPGVISFLSAGPLPEGLKCLLRIVAEAEWRDASTEHAYMRHSAETVRAASAAFLSEVLFARPADPYRVLGLPPGAPLGDVREHKRLLLKWLHPDRNPEAREQEYLSRVIKAAEAIEGGLSHQSGRPSPPRAPQSQALVAVDGSRRRRSAGGRDEKAWQAMAGAARQIASRVVPRALRVAKLSAAYSALLLSILIAWRYLMAEPIGASLARYSELARGIMTWP